MVSGGVQEIYKKIYKQITTFDLHISPLYRAGPARVIFTPFGMWCHITGIIKCQILSRLVKGLGALAVQNRGFSINFVVLTTVLRISNVLQCGGGYIKDATSGIRSEMINLLPGTVKSSACISVKTPEFVCLKLTQERTN